MGDIVAPEGLSYSSRLTVIFDGLVSKVLKNHYTGKKVQPIVPPPKHKRGFVYLIRADNGLCKIGITRNLAGRLREINRVSPVAVKLISFHHSFYPGRAEKVYHEAFADRHIKGEWYALTPIDLQDIMAWWHGDEDELRRNLKAVERINGKAKT